jgi:hypothetical protein
MTIITSACLVHTLLALIEIAKSAAPEQVAFPESLLAYIT